MGQFWLFTGLAGVIGIDLYIAFLSATPTPDAKFIKSLVVFLFLMYYLPFYLYLSLKAESQQLHQWLHTPQPISGLLGSKVLNGLLGMLITLGTASVYPVVLASSNTLTFTTHTNKWLHYGSLMGLSTIATSLLMGLFLLFLWSTAQWMHTYTGKWTWVWIVTGILLFLFALGKGIQFFHDPLIALFPGSKASDIPFFSTDWSLNILILLTVFTSCLIFFILSCWVLDHKVEV